VFAAYWYRGYACNPRAIYERLPAGMRGVWVVKEGATVPDGIESVVAGTEAYRDVLARATYFVNNVNFPDHVVKRPGQIHVMTHHGTPLKQMGMDLADTRGTHGLAGVLRRCRRWDYAVSANAFTSLQFERAYPTRYTTLETGYPRNDVLVRPDRDAAGLELRARLGIPAGVRTVLYAPTFRDNVIDRRNRHRLDLNLDIDRLRDALGRDTVILFRKHHDVLDPVPATADGFVRDVSAYPDGTELLLAADVLITDYSSAMFDYANTGRPMLFFTYDLELFRDEVRGFYFDFEQRAPGPLLRTSDQLAEALADLDAVRDAHAQRYAEFAAEFCELDDGAASGRVVDHIFAQE
jgi:CDP-glycerol glycerophosphotransferase